MDQAIRNKLRGVVTQCRRLLEDSVRDELQGKFGVYAAAKGDDVQVDDEARMTHLGDEERAARKDILDHFAHIKARGFKPKESLDQLVREVAFTHLNRFCAYKMMEARQVYVGDQRFREAVSRGVNSNGVKFYLADHPDDERLFTTGKQDVAYRHFLDWLGGLLSEEIGVLFSPHDPANRLYPPQKVLDEVLALINDEGLTDIWTQDETIGWVYQYFTPKELRDQARKESQAPRNSYELAFRNQFFTPRYVVEFLTDNTLGRIWYEMRKGDTKLKDRCRYMVRRPSEVFLADPLAAAARLGFKVDEGNELPPSVKAAFRGDFASAVAEKDGILRAWIGLVVPQDQYEAATGHQLRENEDHPSVNEVWSALSEHPDGKLPLHPLKIVVALSQLVSTASGGPYAARATDQLWAALATTVAAQAEQSDLSQDELLKLPVCVPHRAKKDPRELKILDPASGSGHFLLYCFDLLLLIYEEAYTDPDLGPALQRDYPTLDALRRDVPRLILAHNLHGIDIDLRASQIAALALWLRCQRAYQEMGLKKDRPRITRSNFVCAEPMPGEGHMLKEFVGQIEPKLLGQLVEVVFDKMKLAGEAGSLLKIEDEIREAVAEAKRQWATGPVLVQRSLFDDDKPMVRQQRFDFSGITDAQFFEQAEAKVVDALRKYAEQAQTGQRLQRRLFTEDAVRGFAFVELCHKRFDVVLMNPPFGQPTKQAKSYLGPRYPESKGDLCTLFIERCIGQGDRGTVVGAITSRTAFFLTSFSAWRNKVILSKTLPLAFLDLGKGVLDTAKVETCAYVLQVKGHEIQSADSRECCFVRLLNNSSKDGMLADFPGLIRGNYEKTTFLKKPADFFKIPGSPFVYWAKQKIVSLFATHEPLQHGKRELKQGLVTTDDFRFVRMWWEVRESSVVDGEGCPTPEEYREQTKRNRRWCPFVKTTKYAFYYHDLKFLVDWANDGSHFWDIYRQHRNKVGGIIKNHERYFTGGITWTARPFGRGSFAHVPSGAIFSHTGMIVFVPPDQHWATCAILNSDPYITLLHLLMARGGRGSDQGLKYEIGYLAVTPFPSCNNALRADLESKAKQQFLLKRKLDAHDETSHAFVAPAVVMVRGSSLTDSIQQATLARKGCDALFDSTQEEINDAVLAGYGLCADDLAELVAMEGAVGNEDLIADDDPQDDPSVADDGDAEASEDEAALSDRVLVSALLSYCIGVSFGRWDLRKGLAATSSPMEAVPESPSLRSPAMFATPHQSECDPFSGYPLTLEVDGILPDDPENVGDIVQRVRSVLELLWPEHFDGVERDICNHLGYPNLRAYLTRPGLSGFWDDHLKRYSKRPRKAPIYWLLQSSKRNYSLWLYYDRLDKDLLFKALVNYVEPKIRLEESRLDSLRTQKAAAGDSGREAKKLGNEVEGKEELLSELRDFEDKLRRAADLHLEPDLNDGVVLNIAPLHELVPWKEAKTYWQQLLNGKYEWSSIGKQLRQKGLVK